MALRFDQTRFGGSASIAWHTLRAATLPLWGVFACALLTTLVSEMVWRTHFGVSSPARALFYVAAAFVLGLRLRTLGGHGRAHEWVENVLFGEAALTLLYVVLACAQLQRIFPFVVVPLIFVSAALQRSLRHSRVRLIHLGFVLVIGLACGRAAFYVDRLSLSVANPTGFVWIDTPLWLDMAYGIERACPVPDLLFADHVANYHFGASALVASIRALTGMPMHVAYYAAMCIGLTTFCFALERVARLLVRPSRGGLGLLRFVAPWFGLVWVEYVVFNFPSVVAIPLFLAGVALSLRAPSWRALTLWLPLLAALVLTKEVAYGFLVLVAGVALLARARRSTLAARLVPFGLAILASRPLYERLIRIDQHPRLQLFSEHLEPEWIHGALAKESHVLLLCLFAAALLFSTRARTAKLWLVPLTAFAVHVTGILLSDFVKPTFDPPMDPFSYHWILVDMGQFESNARQMAIAALAVTALATLAAAHEASIDWRILTPSLSVFTAGYVLLNTWRSLFFPVAEHPEQERRDPAAEVLARIPTANTVLMSDHLNWNHENPHWAAFFGHQFYMLREGRWTTAYSDYAHRREVQARIYVATDPTAVTRILRDEHVTHVIVDKGHPPPWVSGLPCATENARYCILSTQ